jgi:hypothetical protein
MEIWKVVSIVLGSVYVLGALGTWVLLWLLGMMASALGRGRRVWTWSGAWQAFGMGLFWPWTWLSVAMWG